MRGIRAFLRKELCETVRTYKVLIFGAVFTILGVIGPLTAKYMPEMMEKFMPEGMVLNLAPPQAIDSWMQFFKNMTQIGLIVMVILLGGMMASEWAKGTLVLVLTKGLDRQSVILAKFITAFLLWSGAYWLCFGISYGYTMYFWKEEVRNLPAAVCFLWLFGIMLIAVTLLGGVLFKSSYTPLLFTGLAVIILFLLNLVPALAEYNPWMLASGGTQLLEGAKKLSDFVIPALLAGMVTVVSLTAAVLVFNRKQV